MGGKLIGEVPLKESSKYRKFTQDKRVEQLVQYSDKEWAFKEVIDELDDYDSIRSEVFFKRVHELENPIYKLALEKKELENLEVKNNPNFRKYLSYYYLETPEDKKYFEQEYLMYKDINEIQDKFKGLFILALIRNKFAHNELVSKEVFDYVNKKYPIENEERIGSYLDRVFCSILEEFKP